MRTAIIKTLAGYYPVLTDGKRYYSLDQSKSSVHDDPGWCFISRPSPTLEAAKRRIKRAGLTWEPEPPEKITAWAAAKLAGVSYTTIIRWVGRGYLVPVTLWPDQITFTRKAVLACAEKMKAAKTGK